jgi:signal transduction histidine kinase
LCFQGFAVDITAQKNARQERNLMEAHLRQAQKLESVGQLAAGIAHEINTPIQYIGDNIRFVEDSFKELGGVLKDYQDLGVEIRANRATPEALAKAGRLSAATDITYLNEEIPKAIVQCLEGVERISRIVGAMKEFSHPGTADQAPIDLNHSIETALTVTRHEWKYVADVVTEFDAKLPLVPCFPHDFNQVIVNLVVNAAHAIGDVVKHVQGGRGVIKIATRRDGSWVEIRVSDSGTGIPENVRHRIFEPFFTTKEVGKGTGQGLAISHSTVVKKHGGTLSFETVMGQGTVFIIRLPLGGATSLARNGAGARERETANAA